MTHLIRTIGNLVIPFSRKQSDTRLRRVVVQITMAASNRDTRATGHHAWARYISLIDVPTQIHCSERRVFKSIDGVVLVGARSQMRMAVDQPRQNRRLRQIDNLRAGRNLYLSD